MPYTYPLPVNIEQIEIHTVLSASFFYTTDNVLPPWQPALETIPAKTEVYLSLIKNYRKATIPDPGLSIVFKKITTTELSAMVDLPEPTRDFIIANGLFFQVFTYAALDSTELLFAGWTSKVPMDYAPVHVVRPIEGKYHIYSGYEQGLADRAIANLDDLDTKFPGTTIVFDQKASSITLPYFLGLFNNSIVTLGPQGFLSKYLFRSNSVIEKTIVEFQSKINRGEYSHLVFIQPPSPDPIVTPPTTP